MQVWQIYSSLKPYNMHTVHTLGCNVWHKNYQLSVSLSEAKKEFAAEQILQSGTDSQKNRSVKYQTWFLIQQIIRAKTRSAVEQVTLV